MMGVILNNFYSQVKYLTETEKSILTDLDSYPELIATNNLSQLAGILHTSNTAIIRLAQKLGYSGYSEFKFTVNRITNPTSIYQKNFFVSRLKSFVKDFPTETDQDKIDFFAEKIFTSENIYISSIGITKPFGEYLAKKLTQLDKKAVYVHENPFLDLLSNLARKKDLVVFLSVSGEAENLINCAQKLRNSGIFQLSITGSRSNSLELITNQNIATNTEMAYFHNYDISSRVFLMIVIDSIVDVYYQKYILKGNDSLI